LRAFDLVREVIAGSPAATAAMSGSTEEAQFTAAPGHGFAERSRASA
jgi:hypothetical protein